MVSAAGGTVVTGSTRTTALDCPAVWEKTPAQPDSTATSADHLSGIRMKPVSGRLSLEGDPATAWASVPEEHHGHNSETEVLKLAADRGSELQGRSL